MSTSAPTEPLRVRLARVAAGAAGAVPGVARLDAGRTGSWQTAATGGDRVDGVRCVAAVAGYELALQVVAEPVPLLVLSDDVRAAVLRATAAAGLQQDVVRVDVHVSGLADGALG